jgi:hypothetical protein
MLALALAPIATNGEIEEFGKTLQEHAVAACKREWGKGASAEDRRRRARCCFAVCRENFPEFDTKDMYGIARIRRFLSCISRSSLRLCERERSAFSSQTESPISRGSRMR